MTYYDRLNAFFVGLDSDPPTASAQLVYLHLLQENNRLKNPGSFRLTDEKLHERTRLSRQSITSAKRELKNRKLIDFKSSKGNTHAGTIYILPNSVGTPAPVPEPDGISESLRQTWRFNNNNVLPSATTVNYLAEDVKLYGEDAVRTAINRAGQKKRYGELVIPFYRRILDDVVNGREASANARRTVSGSQSVRSLYGGNDTDTAPDD